MRLFRFPFRAMGSPCELQLYTETRRQAKAAAERAMADVALLEARYSRYRADSLLSTINAAAAHGEPVERLETSSRLHQPSSGERGLQEGLAAE
jgi:thiamine biosynthesis lipoprotein